MKDGFIKVCAASPRVSVADCTANTDNILETAKSAAASGAKLIVFPELSVTAYTCGDLFFQDTLLNAAEKSLERIITESADIEAVMAVGLPYMRGGKLYNCAAVVCRGKILGIVPKTYLPNYGEYYEKRYFAPAPTDNCEVEIAGQRTVFGTKQIFTCKDMPAFSFGAEICEDLWVPLPPSAYHTAAGANIIVNLSASSEAVGKADFRRQLISSHSARLLCAYIYADAGEGESTGDAVFAGHCIIAENGSILAEKLPFEQKLLIYDIDVGAVAAEKRRTAYAGESDKSYAHTAFDLPLCETELQREYSDNPFYVDADDCEQILTIQATGLKRRLEHIHAASAVLGISGGLDSTLALLVAVRAFDMMAKPRKDIIAVTMPCFGTSKRTKTNAVSLCEKLGVTLRTIDIKKAVSGHFKDIAHDPNEFNVVYENAQARERTQILMDIANAENGIVIGTGDLSELALGFATYNGDHMSMYGVNAAVPKTQIRRIVTHCADTAGGEVGKVLRDIVNTPVSPELLPPENGAIAQKTEEIVGAYELHDFFIFYMLKYGFSPKKLYRIALRAFGERYDKAEILRCLKTLYRRFFAQQYKRSCLPDGPRIGQVALSPRGDWRMPGDAIGKLWLEEIEEIE